ncbi:MAG TPA: hypothetical protein VF316_14225 [Polyangiaceae bacterium]
MAERVPDLYARAAARAVPAATLDALLRIAEEHGGERRLMKNARSGALARSREMVVLANESARHHGELHRLLDLKSPTPCDPTESASCTSRNATLRAHFGASARVSLEATRTLPEALRLAEARRFAPDLPRSCVDLGSVSAFLHEKLGFAHSETALLRVHHRRGVTGNPPAPIREGEVRTAATAIRKAYSEHRKKHPRRFVRKFSPGTPPKRATPTSAKGS